MTNLALVLLAASQTFSLPPGLLSALCFVESSHRPAMINPDDGKSPSLGLCQVKLSTARLLGYRASERGLMSPKVNSYYAAKYLDYQLRRYSGDTDRAIAAYNSGTHRTDENGLTKNQKYVNKVNRAWREKR